MIFAIEDWALCCGDVLGRGEGYQLKGRVTIETAGRRFEETAQWIDEMSNKAGFPLKSKAAIILRIEEIYGIAPGPGAGKQQA